MDVRVAALIALALMSCAREKTSVVTRDEVGAPTPSATVPACEQRALVHAPMQPDPAHAFGDWLPPGCHGCLVSFDFPPFECRCRFGYPVYDGMVQAGEHCGLGFEKRDLSPFVRLELEAPRSFRSGETVKLTARVRNDSDRVMPLRVDAEPGESNGWLRIFDVGGKDVTRIGPCGHGSSRSAVMLMIAVDPAGVIEWHMKWDGSFDGATLDAKGVCAVSRKPLPPGKYTLEWISGLLDLPKEGRSARASFEVTP